MQFLPSSPLRDEKVKKADPFEFPDTRGRCDYPTPHPSSSIGRSSSPHYGDEDIYPKKVAFEIDRPIETAKPLESVRITKVPLLASRFSIGRSSRMCDIAIRTRDRSMSRKHLQVSHDDNMITIECLGANGYGITIPRSCTVTKKGLVFELEESRLLVNKTNKISTTSTIKIGDNITEFLVQKGETIKLPKFYNLILEIKNNLLLVNPKIDEETDDEELIKLTTPIKDVNAKRTPIKQTLFVPPTPQKRVFMLTAEENTPIKKMPLLNNTSDRNPLKDISNIRGKSEEPKKSPPAASHNRSHSANVVYESPEPEVDLSTVDLKEITNILVNHLAFSRLASTKLEMLRTISANVNEFSRAQLKDLLSKIPSIGVIYREGKDAAGKPLDPEYYYIPEKDDDEGRKNLVATIKGHGGIRSCRTTHKQYYWKKPAPIKNKHKK